MIVESEEPAHPGSLTIDPEQSVALRSPDGHEVYEFTLVVGAGRFADGTVVVADGPNGELKYFDAEGTFVRSVGRQGDGPGEFRRLSWAGVCRDNRVFTYDSGTGRLSVFTSDGTFVRGWRLAKYVNRLPSKLSCTDGSPIVMLTWPQTPFVREASGHGMAALPHGPYRPEAELWVFDPDKDAATPITRTLSDERYYYTRSTSVRPMGLVTVLAANTEGIVVGTGPGYELTTFDLDGLVRRTLRRPLPSGPVSADMIEDYIEHRVLQLPVPNELDRERRLRLFRALRWPSALPPFRMCLLDDQGNLWVEGYAGRAFGKPAVWSVFSPDGTWTTDVTMPVNTAALQISGNSLVAVRHNDMSGAETLVVHRILE